MKRICGRKERARLYTLLIVDDEEIERDDMARLIPWEKYGYRLVGTAGNGAEGLDQIGGSARTSPSWTSRCR